MVITTQKAEESGQHRSVIWEGDLEILDENEYLMMISMIGEGQPQPLVTVPFGLGIGHYVWIPPNNEYESLTDDGSQEYMSG